MEFPLSATHLLVKLLTALSFCVSLNRPVPLKLLERSSLAISMNLGSSIHMLYSLKELDPSSACEMKFGFGEFSQSIETFCGVWIVDLFADSFLWVIDFIETSYTRENGA